MVPMRSLSLGIHVSPDVTPLSITVVPSPLVVPSAYGTIQPNSTNYYSGLKWKLKKFPILLVKYARATCTVIVEVIRSTRKTITSY